MKPLIVILFYLYVFCEAFSVDQCPSFEDDQPIIGIDENQCYAFFNIKLTFSDSHEFCNEKNGIIPYSSTQASPFLYKAIQMSDGLAKSGLHWYNFWSQGIFNCAQLDVTSGKFTHEISCSGKRHVACQFEPIFNWPSNSSSISSPSSLSSPSKPNQSIVNSNIQYIGIISILVFIILIIITITRR